MTELKAPKNSKDLENVEGKAEGGIENKEKIRLSRGSIERNKGNPNKEPIDDLA